MSRLCLLLFLVLVLPASLSAQETAVPGADRPPREQAAIRKWASLPHDRQIQVLKTLGVTMSEAYLSCVCRAAGYGTSSTQQYYHPDTIGDYNPTYSCTHPGPPCVVAGFGCSRYDLPSDPKLWESCAAQPEFAASNPMSALITASKDRAARKKITGDPVAKAPPPEPDSPPDCAKARAEVGFAQSAVLADVPPERQISIISPETIKKLAEVGLSDVVRDKLIGFIEEGVSRINDKIDIGDEKDLRFDFDEAGVEVGVTIDAKKRIHISEIVVKHSVLESKFLNDDLKLNGETAIAVSVADPGDPNTLAGHKATGIKIGFSAESKALGIEGKYGIDVSAVKSADDYYDGVWQKESEYKVVQAVENMVSKLDFYAGGAAGKEFDLAGGGTVNVGPEVTWKVKDRYTNWLFSDMRESLDNLLANQKAWEDKRHEYLASEAKRFGIDARCFSVGDTISLTRAAWERRKMDEPGLAPPFASLNKKAGPVGTIYNTGD